MGAGGGGGNRAGNQRKKCGKSAENDVALVESNPVDHVHQSRKRLKVPSVPTPTESKVLLQACCVKVGVGKNIRLAHVQKHALDATSFSRRKASRSEGTASPCRHPDHDEEIYTQTISVGKREAAARVLNTLLTM